MEAALQIERNAEMLKASMKCANYTDRLTKNSRDKFSDILNCGLIT